MIEIKVSEIFTSFQGEGPYIGTPATFLRLYGCNLNCEWCDTDISTYEMLSVDDVAEILMTQMEFNNINLLVITGGEPTLQMEEIKRLIKELPEDIKIQLETNGSIFEYLPEIEYVISPKEDKEKVFENYHKYDNVFFKFVITSKEDIDEVIAIKNKYGYDKTIWLQGEFSKDALMADLIREDLPRLENIKLSVQTHKYLSQR
ncbi:MAG: 7-carboxy-7-deazaguanine synthase QueE [Methanobrevibacter ruminantium]|uniref:7-carboxy-7-deazaguanine synthase QueE n=1 Tax=Methanobrevibacter ruminantium TaxID=83816 RepID=UPI0026ECFFEA|nr:7-carboxy-7-deazaguanine synthase QueE [Methanobrevibacter ruminantium]MDD6048281.1 7-carboxy-7-deazaguanine synthase QueE [Methanobrevibacter ruminantium]